jgi:hypothetical protein
MMNVNYHVYKKVNSEGQTHYEGKQGDLRSSSWDKSLEVIALRVWTGLDYCHRHAEEVDLGVTSINFTPFHDIEWIKGYKPERCFPLTEEDRAEFWKHFAKFAKRK